MSRRPVVVIFRNELLPASETFIPAQAEAFAEHQPIYVGVRRVKGLDLPADRVFVVADGSAAPRLAEFRMLLGRPHRRLLRRLREREPVLVHAHFEGGGLVALPLARALGVPLVVTGHGYDMTVYDEARWPQPLARRYYQRRRRQLQHSGAHFVAVSEHIRRAMVARGYPEARTHVLHIGVDIERLRPAETAGNPVVLFVGRLVEKKGAEYLIRAMGIVESAVPGARLLVVGDGPLRGTLEALARATLSRATFLGERPHAETLDLMRHAGVLSVPTVRAANGDMDGCATVFAEAHALGVPVVAFATGGTPEAVLHGKTGWLAEEGDVAGLAHGLVALLTDQHFRFSCAAAARRHAGAHFDLRRQTARLEALYESVIHGR